MFEKHAHELAIKPYFLDRAVLRSVNIILGHSFDQDKSLNTSAKVICFHIVHLSKNAPFAVKLNQINFLIIFFSQIIHYTRNASLLSKILCMKPRTFLVVMTSRTWKNKTERKQTNLYIVHFMMMSNAYDVRVNLRHGTLTPL